MNKGAMCQCEIRQVGRFDGWDDFDEFITVLNGEPSLVPARVAQPDSYVGLVERWYQCSACATMWRLVEPDPPFEGLWQKVDSPQP
jgi:hypothetical protein